MRTYLHDNWAARACAATLGAAVFALSLGAASAQDSAKPDSAEPDWAESQWGANDELGAANHMTPDRVKLAAELVTEGKVYSLGMIVGSDTPAFPPRSLSVTILQPSQNGNSGLGANKFTYNDDIFMGWLGIGPQIDGLGHAGVDHVYYGGRHYDDFAPASGLTELGLDKLPGLVGRGVMLDMAAYYGVDMVQEGTPYTEEDIRGAAEAQGVELREGDVVLFNSNWMDLLDGDAPDPERFGAQEPGVGVSGAEYLTELGVMAVGADTWGMEVVPAETEGDAFRVHQILQPEHGIYILENMDTRALADDGVHEFLFVLGQARIKGAVQMIINPIAIR
ncbi:cyclase family protein [Salipiger aestuarii]|uniref:Kynurenine formamidase n=1 Tax=Salipiger aestuarii TaxID=568098 RepID=A0A327XTK3_9RHOB|nr:cyclase family protein [Salipiger aestuarii]EIE49978.1 putative cyclase [Citreicella sp. 357]RAK12000.1 kynurenine formamidase [Salipiger aestuarii]